MLRGLSFIGLGIGLALVVWLVIGQNFKAGTTPADSPDVVSRPAGVAEALCGSWRLVETLRGHERTRVAVAEARSPENRPCTLQIESDLAQLSAALPFGHSGLDIVRTWSVESLPDQSGWCLTPAQQPDPASEDFPRLLATREGEHLRVASISSSMEWIFESRSETRTTIFLVHGTYDATSDWTREVPESITFASEMRRALGTENVRIEPFLWRTSVQHAARDQAAVNLAALLDDPRFAEDRVVLVGHSHGGNVCLSAAGRCQRRIDVAICLATPHMHVLMQDERQQPAALPVYLTPRGRANIGMIVNVWAQTDPVVAQRVNALLGPWAAVRSGLEEQVAIHAVHDWRREQNFPRLIHKDGPIKELLAEYTGAKSKSHLTTLPRLSVADHEFELTCEVNDVTAHSVIHSRRVGHVLGAAVQDGFSAEMVEYLSGLWLRADSDTGGPVAPSVAEAWWAAHRDDSDFNGWLLKSLEVNGKSRNQPNGAPWDRDGSWPDLYVAWTMDSTGLQGSSGVGDGSGLRSQPWWRFPPDTAVAFEIRDRDPVSTDELLGQFQVPAESSVPSPFVDDTEAYSLRVEWLRLHD